MGAAKRTFPLLVSKRVHLDYPVVKTSVIGRILVPRRRGGRLSAENEAAIGGRLDGQPIVITRAAVTEFPLLQDMQLQRQRVGEDGGEQIVARADSDRAGGIGVAVRPAQEGVVAACRSGEGDRLAGGVAGVIWGGDDRATALLRQGERASNERHGNGVAGRRTCEVGIPGDGGEGEGPADGGEVRDGKRSGIER